MSCTCIIISQLYQQHYYRQHTLKGDTEQTLILTFSIKCQLGIVGPRQHDRI